MVCYRHYPSRHSSHCLLSLKAKSVLILLTTITTMTHNHHYNKVETKGQHNCHGHNSSCNCVQYHKCYCCGNMPPSKSRKEFHMLLANKESLKQLFSRKKYLKTLNQPPPSRNFQNTYHFIPSIYTTKDWMEPSFSLLHYEDCRSTLSNRRKGQPLF